MEAETEIPPPGPTIDLGEEEEYSFFKDQQDKGDDDDDDEGPGHFGRSGRVVSSGAQPSQGVIGGESFEAPGDKQRNEGEKGSTEGEQLFASLETLSGTPLIPETRF